MVEGIQDGADVEGIHDGADVVMNPQDPNVSLPDEVTFPNLHRQNVNEGDDGLPEITSHRAVRNRNRAVTNKAVGEQI